MITKWLYSRYTGLDTDDEFQEKIFYICATIIFLIAVLSDIFLIVPEFIYCLFKTLLIILKGNEE